MPIREFEGQLCIVRLELSPAEIPDLLVRQANNYPGTQAVESAGLALIQNNFEPDASIKFVQSVCEWGRGHRHLGRIPNNKFIE